MTSNELMINCWPFAIGIVLSSYITKTTMFWALKWGNFKRCFLIALIAVSVPLIILILLFGYPTPSDKSAIKQIPFLVVYFQLYFTLVVFYPFTIAVDTIVLSIFKNNITVKPFQVAIFANLTDYVIKLALAFAFLPGNIS